MQVIGVQLNSVWEDKPANHRRVRQLLAAEAIPAGSLIVLPEMFDTGFSMQLDVTAQGAERASERFLQEIACQTASTVIGGVVSPIIDGMGRNEAVVFSPDGNELARYCKRRPFSLSGEDRCHRRGEQTVVFQWNGVAVSPFVCYDLRFPELFREAIDQGAELLLVIACWPAIRSEHWVRLLQARAIENLAIAIGVNRCGSEPNLPFDGRSCGFDEQGRSLLEVDNAEQVFRIDIDIDRVRNWRQAFPALRDR
jgi:omega-amidase